MPGLAMDPSQVSANATQRSPRNKSNDDTSKLQQVIKNENDDTISDDEYDEDTYKPRPQLPKPFIFMRSLADLTKDLDNGRIDVDPEYQREIVWTADRMTGLINSLMENFYIPPIILNKKMPVNQRDKSQEAVHVCVDGKQRLLSVRAFVKGMIPCQDHRGEKWWFCDAQSNQRKKVLCNKTKKVFLAKEFVSFEFKDLSPEQEEDLSARVQMGVQLSIAEKIRASTGPWQELARLFVDDFPIVYSLMKDRARAKDFQLTLSCFSQILETMHPTASDGIPVLKTNHNALPKLLSNKGAVDDGLKSRLASVWNTFKDLVEEDHGTFNNATKYLRGVQTFAPVEMVAVTVLISMYSSTRDNQLLLGDIKAMREAIRENFADLRMNAPVWKFVWDFIDNLEAIRGAVDRNTVYRNEGQSSKSSASTTAVVLHRTAASAPKAMTRKAKPSAGWKAPLILPPQQPFTVKKEEGTYTLSMEPRPAKRQRTDSGPICPANLTEEHSDIFINAQSSPLEFESPGHRFADLALAQPQYPTMPTHASVQHVAQTPAQDPFLQEDYVSGLNNQQGFNSPMELLPASVAQIQQLSDTSTSSVHLPVSLSSASSVSTSHQLRRASNSTTCFRTGSRAFSPMHTEQQWAGEVRSISPTDEALVCTASLSKRRPVKKTRKDPKPSTLVQYDGAFDLTSDTD